MEHSGEITDSTDGVKWKLLCLSPLTVALHAGCRSLTAAVEQIENNARDLGQLQMKLDEWKRSGLDEREIAMRAKDEQLTSES